MAVCMESVSKEDFTAIHILGRGRFGRVYQMERKGTLENYAMKVILKEEILDARIKNQLKNEIELQSRLDHTYILRLKMQCEDTKYVYLFMDLAESGSLHYYLLKLRRFPELQTGKYIKQLLSALSYLHKNNIMHRDIKPENLMLSREGNLLLGDFGWSNYISKDGGEERLTVCGTPEYIPPEMIMNKPHSETVDSWAVGILCYELLVGCTPFKGKGTNRDETFTNIISGSMEITPIYSFSESLQNFLACCLVYDSSLRSTCSQLLTTHVWVLSQDENALNIVDYSKNSEKKKNVCEKNSDDIIDQILRQCEQNSSTNSNSSCSQHSNSNENSNSNGNSSINISNNSNNNSSNSSSNSSNISSITSIDSSNNNDNISISNNSSGSSNNSNVKNSNNKSEMNKQDCKIDSSIVLEKRNTKVKGISNALKRAYLCTKLESKENIKSNKLQSHAVIKKKSQENSNMVLSKSGFKSTYKIVNGLKERDININANSDVISSGEKRATLRNHKRI